MIEDLTVRAEEGLGARNVRLGVHAEGTLRARVSSALRGTARQMRKDTSIW